MDNNVKEIMDKVIELLKNEEVTFPWIFVAENVDINAIRVLMTVSNLEFDSKPVGNSRIEEIFDYIIHEQENNS